jgi:hypothetical protein
MLVVVMDRFPLEQPTVATTPTTDRACRVRRFWARLVFAFGLGMSLIWTIFLGYRLVILVMRAAATSL